MIYTWISHFKKEERQTPDSILFQTTNEEEIFQNHFYEYLKNNGIKKKEIFYAIHYAFAMAKKINLDDIEIIISHEHVTFPFKKIIKEFPTASYLFVIRDPRAGIAGFFKGISKKMANLPDYHDHYINMSIEEWLNTVDIYNKYRKSLGNQMKILKNEDLVNDLNNEMEDLANWLGIDFSINMLRRSNYDGSLPHVDSSYLTKTNEPDKSFFNPEAVKIRWLSELSDERELIMIESLFSKIMKKFDYDLITKISLKNKVKGMYYFLLPHRGPKRLKFYEPDESEFIRYINRLKLLNKKIHYFIFYFSPKFLKKKIIIFYSIYIHFKILFIPMNRWSRYDNPLVEKTYRNYA